MTMNPYTTGDFVKLKHPDKYTNTRCLNKGLNIFRITGIGDDGMQLEYIEGSLPLAEIEPIPINGIDDNEIYYDPIVAASIVAQGESVPLCNRDYSYYFDRLKDQTFGGKTFGELVEERQLRFVHQVQHFFRDKTKCDNLNIKNDY